MHSLFKFKNRSDFQKELRKFFKLADNITYKPRSGGYNEKFSNGDDKALEVIYFLMNNQAPMSELAYISIGGADGADVIKVLQNTQIPVGILVEYDSDFCNKAREESRYLMHHKKMIVVEGDAYANRYKVRDLLQSLIRDKKIKGVVITGFSIFHELPYRTPSNDYNLRNLIIEMTEGIREVYFYSKEPCDFEEWCGRLEIAFPMWLKADDLFHFATIIQKSLSYKNSAEFNEKIIKVKDGVEMHSALATEVVKKLLYFLKDGSVDNLLYELQESHSKFHRAEFSKKITEIFNSGSKKIDFDVKTRLATSNTFSKLYLQSGIKLKSINDSFLNSLVPMGFTVLSAYFRPTNHKKERPKVDHLIAGTAEYAVTWFYECIEKKNFAGAFSLLNHNLKSYRWNNDVERFKDGYLNKLSVKLIAHSALKENMMGEGFIVYLQEQTNSYYFDHSIPDNILRDSLSEIDFDDLKTRWEKIKAVLMTRAKYPEGILKSPFFRLLQPHSIEDFRWISGISVDDMQSVFNQKIITTHSTYLVFCQEEDLKWYITKISPVIFNGVPLK